MFFRNAIILSVLFVAPFFVTAKESKNIYWCKQGDFEFSFSAPDMEVGKIIILMIWLKNEESKGAIGIVRELSQGGDLVADFPVGSDLKLDPKKITTTVKYISSLKEGILTVAPGKTEVGYVVSGKCQIKKASR